MLQQDYVVMIIAELIVFKHRHAGYNCIECCMHCTAKGESVLRVMVSLYNKHWLLYTAGQHFIIIHYSFNLFVTSSLLLSELMYVLYKQFKIPILLSLNKDIRLSLSESTSACSIVLQVHTIILLCPRHIIIPCMATHRRS